MTVSPAGSKMSLMAGFLPSSSNFRRSASVRRRQRPEYVSGRPCFWRSLRSASSSSAVQ